MRYGCILRRGQWRVPHVTCVDRRNRKRFTLAQSVARAANINDPELAPLERRSGAFASFAQIVHVPEATPAVLCLAVDARPGDMLLSAQPFIVLDPIVREATAVRWKLDLGIASAGFRYKGFYRRVTF